MAARVGPAFTGERGVPSTVRIAVAAQARREGATERHTLASPTTTRTVQLQVTMEHESREIQRNVFSTADVPTTLLSHIDEGSFPSPTRGWLHEPDMGVLSGMAGMLSQGQGSVGRLDNSLARGVIRDDAAVQEEEVASLPGSFPCPGGY
jgi:hypothetical protein